MALATECIDRCPAPIYALLACGRGAKKEVDAEESGRHGDAMRTTIDIPDPDHARLTALARERRVTLGALLVELANRGLARTQSAPGDLRRSPRTGLLTVSTGVPTTHEEVRTFLEDGLW
jgi:hypothetical protein